MRLKLLDQPEAPSLSLEEGSYELKTLFEPNGVVSESLALEKSLSLSLDLLPTVFGHGRQNLVPHKSLVFRQVKSSEGLISTIFIHNSISVLLDLVNLCNLLKVKDMTSAKAAKRPEYSLKSMFLYAIFKKSCHFPVRSFVLISFINR